jgi:putative ABC transport system permease protein
VQTIRQALRSLRQRPGLVLLTVLVLAIGIGANVAIFTVVEARILRPLPYRDPDRLAMVWERIPEISDEFLGVTEADTLDFRDSARAFESIAAFQPRGVNLAFAGEAVRVHAARVTASLFPLLGVEPALGRWLTEDEDRFGAPEVVVLGFDLWRRHFGSDREVIGKRITLDHLPFTVVGVMPRGFRFPDAPVHGFEPAELYVPMAVSPAELRDRGNQFDTALVGRLRAGVNLAAATDDAARIAELVYRKYPASVRGRFTLQATVTSLREEVVSGVRRALFLLQGAVGLVLLIACANAANLLLAHAAGRRREIAIRGALGAGRGGIIRMLLAESLILSLASGSLGVLLALWAVDALMAMAPEALTGLRVSVLDPGVVAFAVLVSLATGFLFGIVPAIPASRASLAEVVGTGARSGSTFRKNRPRRALVAGEVALSVVLLSAAALLVRSFLGVMSVDPGFEPDGAVAFTVSLDESKYPNDTSRAFFDRLLSSLGSLPAVTALGAGTSVPLEPSDRILISLEGEETDNWGRNLCWYSVVEGDYFEALGIPLIKGRAFGADDRRETRPVVIVNETLVRKYWPGQDGVGKRFKWGSPTSSAPYMEIVGVVRDSVQQRLGEETLPAVYIPYRQLDAARAPLRPMTIVARSRRDVEPLARAIRSEIQGLDPELPMFGLRTLPQAIHESERDRRFLTVLVAAFGAAAILLAAAGLVGVLGHSVTLATREIAVRMALGARAGRVIGMVLWDGAKLTGAGLLLGTLGSLVATPALSGELYSVSPHDPLVLGGTALAIGLVSALATYLPARRATRVDPGCAMRSE